ncbi:NfeD family protein [Shouchella shacheensis]|uniref:NfeD family protein n=1 Tax=Shouchella shacheensis TaxID=1649580 RepID=UPI000A8ECE42|nr:nodulation protein NfeD [Shouchella shacheensis]
MSKWLKLSLTCWVFVMALLPLHVVGQENETSDTTVYFIPVEQTVERGLEAFLDRSFNEATEAGADRIVLEINTPGGAVDAAGNIARIINQSDVPVTAFINTDAISAGAFIALNADEIVMAPNGQMGSAGVIDGAGNAADEKAQSYWVSQMRTAAEENGPDGGRDPDIAQAMADSTFPVEGLSEGDQFLTLNASQALENGYAEEIVENRGGLLEYFQEEHDYTSVTEVDTEVSIAEHIARFVTNPIVIPILLSVGSLGLILELYSPGFGIPGIMGISALLLFFFGHMVAGFAGWESLILLVVGGILLGVEAFAPGFGIFGILGAGLVVGGLLMASFSTTVMIFSVAIAVVVTIAAAVVLFVYFGDRGPWKKLVLNEEFSSEKGYVSSETKRELVGKEGRALTKLRPAGTAIFGDERLDVVSEGGYIEQGSLLKIVYTSGSRVVVRALELAESTNEGGGSGE